MKAQTAPNSSALPKRFAGTACMRRCHNTSKSWPVFFEAVWVPLRRRSVSKAPGSRPLMVTPWAALLLRAARVVDEDVDLRAGRQCGGTTFGAGDVAGDGAHLAAVQRAQLRCRGLKRLVAARGDHHVHALAHQRCGAALAEPLARGAHQ